jgi:hypothetical protein
VSSIFDALRKRFAHPEWAYFEEVRNGTGFSRRTTRTADGLAFSTWPSRGLELHGIEVKVSRGDWLREKGDPEKAEEIARFCDRWWLAVTPKVVLDVAEVPPAWGLIEWDGKRWRTHRDASKRQDVQPLDRLMLAAILRKASETEQKRIQEYAARVAADMQKSEVEAAEARAENANLRAENLEQVNRKLRHLLNRVMGYLDGRLDLVYSIPDELPPHVVERLEAARNVDLEQARREAQWALGQLRAAAVTARQALRRAGVRPQPRGPRVPVLP